MIGLIDYGSGNLRSVSKAIEHSGGEVRLVRVAGDFEGLNAVVLPGVGAFGDCVRHLQASGLWKPVGNWLNADRPFLGICLGYQLLFEGSDESSDAEGFGKFAGRVVRFPSGRGLKVPHMGWNTVRFSSASCPLWAGIEADPYVYFVHSYYPEPVDRDLVSGTTAYGEEFAAAIWAGNTFAMQFHPEKSQAVGLKMLSNFVALVA